MEQAHVLTTLVDLLFGKTILELTKESIFKLVFLVSWTSRYTVLSSSNYSETSCHIILVPQQITLLSDLVLSNLNRLLSMEQHLIWINLEVANAQTIKDMPIINQLVKTRILISTATLQFQLTEALEDVPDIYRCIQSS